MSNEKKPETNEEGGLTEEELADVTGGAGAVVTARTDKTVTTVEKLKGGASAIHVKSLFGGLPGGGTRVIKQAGQ